MRTIGLDIGTTTISAVVTESDSGQQLIHRTIPNGTDLFSPHPWERIQDPEQIATKCLVLVDELTAQFAPVDAIGLTGQMHGIVYVDADGHAVTPLYTWQDQRGGLPHPDGLSWANQLSRRSGYSLSPGFGLVTHAWNVAHQHIPIEAVHITTIGGYVGMCLARRTTPLLHSSDGASFGFFSVQAGAFDRKALAAVGLTDTFLPQLTSSAVSLGTTPRGIPVVVGIGDNQASFLGAVPETETGAVLLNMGTGGQISVYSENYVQCAQCETRPFLKDTFLLVGASLCGGRSYAILERFFRECCLLAGVKPDSLYQAMDALLAQPVEEPLDFRTTFCGTRAQPDLRASIRGLSETNFTPQHFVRGVLEGMAEELWEYYQDILPCLTYAPKVLVCSGNAIQKNPALQTILSKRFALPISLSKAKEEAAYGASRMAAGYLRGLT